MKTYALMAVCLWQMAFILSNCGGGTEVSNPISTSTKLVSTSLDDGATESSNLRSAVKRKAVSTDCEGSFDSCLTPGNVSGQVYYAGLLVGIEDGYSVGPILGDVRDPSQITSFDPATLHDFDLSAQVAVEGEIVCCGGAPYPADADAILWATHIYFSYTDLSFTLTAEDGVAAGLVGDHVIRLVFGDIDASEMKKGDLLYKGAGDADFLWCTEADGCVFDERPDAPLQYAEVASYNGTPDGLGNQTIPSFWANLADGHEEIILTEDDVTANALAITVDFEMTNAIGWSSDVTTFDAAADLVSSFGLMAQPGEQEGGFTSTVSVEMTPLTE